jgi:hypothetical protein
MEFFVLSTLVLLVIVIYQFIVNKEQYEELDKLKNTKVVRAKDDKGKYIADDPSTPDVNEAYKTVPKTTQAPAKKNNNSRRGRKPAAK